MSSLLIATNIVTADCHSQPCAVSGDRPASMFCTEASFVQKWQSSSGKEGEGLLFYLTDFYSVLGSYQGLGGRGAWCL